ncbi:MAG: hypothetical protein IPK60_22780 [Sandaracinaceae bacterium]|nr:hypothetical protein [Sandaracinaceae bacterium]
MTRLIIDRAKWGRGAYSRNNAPCCVIGHWMHSDQPAGAYLTLDLQEDIAKANDNMPDGIEREQRIAELFAQVGAEVVYVGDYQ